MDIKADTLPLDIFEAWMAEAKAHPHIKDANAMSLATAGQDGSLHVRVVLCKLWSANGFIFFSNYQSRKGLDLLHNPNAAAVFFWDPLFKQIKMSGAVIRTSREVSVEYWNSRPRASQLSQFISRQSQEAPDRSTLEEEVAKAEREFEGKSIPCPEHWGGYLLKPERMEFWIGQPGRLHDRHEFELARGLWAYRRLYP